MNSVQVFPAEFARPRFWGALLGALVAILITFPCKAASQPAPLTPPQLDQLVQRIALYPDPLLVQVLTASTYWDQLSDAAAWADQHSYLKGDALAQAIQADHLQWDPSVLGHDGAGPSLDRTAG